MRYHSIALRLLVTFGWAACLPLAADAQTAVPPPTVKIPWDWSGIIGTGQSLAVGQGGRPAASTKQANNNLMLSTGNLRWPIDPADTSLILVPLIEPIGRPSMSYPSSWPTNIAGETPHTSMADEITALMKAATGGDFISVHGEFGENGQGIRFLRKDPEVQGVNGRAYEGSMVETKAIARLAKAVGMTYGIGAIIVTHGENDAGNTKYEEQLHQLWKDYNADLPIITGQTQTIQMIVSQQNSTNNRSASTLAQWRLGVDFPGEIVCSGPKYQYPSPDGTHLTTEGYRELGEKYGQIYFDRVILLRDWQPLQPTDVRRDGQSITVHFHIPVGPLMWETAFDLPHQTVEEWKLGKGFEITTSAGKRVAISSSEIIGDAVLITCATDPGANALVSYAMNGERIRMAKPFAGTTRWGLLRDSDSFKGVDSGKSQPNYALAFEMSAP